LVRDEYGVDPGVTLYRPPSIVADAEIGAGLRFP